MEILKEKKFIILIIALIIAIVSLLIFNNLNKISKEQSQDNIYSSDRIIYSHQLIDIENLETSLYETKKIANYKIASKYPQSKEAYTVDANVDMYLEDNHTGRVIFIRDGDTKLNVLQFKYEINQSEENPETIQLDQIINDFRLKCTSDIGVFDNTGVEDDSAIVDGMQVPISEKVYFYKELHSINYKNNDHLVPEEEMGQEEVYDENQEKNYDVNFYMDGDNTLICEFVRIL